MREVESSLTIYNDSLATTNNAKQAAWVAIGSFVSFSFAIVSSMILSRYFDKEEYGTYKQVLYVYNSLLTIFTLGLPKAFSYFLPRSPLNEAKSLIRKITNLFFFLGGILSILLFITSGFIADFLRNPELEVALKVFSPVPFLLLPTMGLDGILATYKETKSLAGYTVFSRAIMLVCVTIPVMFFDLNCIEALIGFNIGSLLSCLLALKLKFYPVKNEEEDSTSVAYKDIFHFSLPLLFASIWGILINSTDQFFISRYFGTEVFAEFSNGAMELPFAAMIIGACSTVLTPLFVKQLHDGADFRKEIYPVWINSFKKSAMLIYPIVVFCLFDAPLIMSVMYGDIYMVSGDYFRIKLLIYFIRITSFYSILMALGATKFYSKVYMFVFLFLVPLEYIVVLVWHNSFLVLAIHVCLEIGYNLLFLFYIANKFSVTLYSLFPLRLIMKILASSCAAGMIMFALKNIFYSMHLDLLKIVLDAGIFVLCFIMLSFFAGINYLKDLNISFRLK